jgi:hypothetical protein
MKIFGNPFKVSQWRSQVQRLCSGLSPDKSEKFDFYSLTLGKLYFFI